MIPTKTKRKGQLEGLLSGLMFVIIIGVSVAIGLYTLARISSAIATAAGSSGTLAENATNTTITAIALAPSWLSIVVIVIIGSSVLALLIGSLYFGVMRKR